MKLTNMKLTNMKTTKICVWTLCSLLTSVPAFAAKKEKCTFEFDAKGTQMKWTAFKTTEKLAVAGSFDKVKVKPHKNKASAMIDLVHGAKFTIEAMSVNSGNPTRDATLKTVFFGKLDKKEITGVVKKIGATPRGVMDVEIQLNGVSKVIPFEYSVQEDGKFESTGKIEAMDFNLKLQHEALSQACKALHAGKDGVSKTWTEVDLQLVSQFKKTCR